VIPATGPSVVITGVEQTSDPAAVPASVRTTATPMHQANITRIILDFISCPFHLFLLCPAPAMADRAATISL
jgi:hypothetical protein